MRLNASIRKLVILWLAWALLVIGFQALVAARLKPQRPDMVLDWTPSETMASSQNDRRYLIDPFMNHQVSWDSEYYLSIATVGYDDPAVETAPGPWRPDIVHEPVPLNYAFFPLYPYVMRAISLPLRLLGLTPIGTATLAGVLASLLGTLGGMLALYDLTRDKLEETGGIRTAFYLLIFPTGFFLAQVYTEGLFVGLAFGSLALIRRKKWVWAAILAALATWTRGVGVALVIPLAIGWYQETRQTGFTLKPFGWQTLGKALLVLAPLAAYALWRVTLGEQFSFVEETFFSRGALLIDRSIRVWLGALRMIGGENPQTAIYYGIEFAAMLLALATCLATLRDNLGLSLFGLAVLIISATSGVPQSAARYVLAAPSIFIVLSRLGRHEVFDRAWTLTSTLLMGLLATLFTFDMWVA